MDLYGHKVNQLGRRFSKHLNEGISSYGLYSSQLVIAMYLHLHGECAQSELGQYLCVEAPTITRTITRMEKSGWVERREGNDRREKIISLTEKAIGVYSEWEEISEDIEKRALEGIENEELEVFERVLEKMMNNLK